METNNLLTLTLINGQKENWYKGDCICGKFSTHLPTTEAVELMHLEHLFLNHKEYEQKGIEINWKNKGGN